MPRDLRAGFTLIELLVVIAILGLLFAFFAPDIFGAQQRAEKAADQANLRWHYQQILLYRDKHKTLPRGSGHKFVLDTWVRGIPQRTPKNFERYWVPGMTDNDMRWQELKGRDPETVWRDYDALDSQDTQYAGPSAEARKSRQRLWGNGKLPLMSDDNEGAPAFIDQSVNILMGDGTVYEITSAELEEKYDFVPADEFDFVPVGPDSPHPWLQMLEP